MNKPRILFSVPTRHHVEIALDELEGMQELGYTCGQFAYAAKEGVESKIGRLSVIVNNALNLVKTARQFKPDIIYFNSRLEKLAGLRDFITIAICKTLYRKQVKFVIKSHGSDIDVLNDDGSFFYERVLPFLKKNVSAWLFLSTEEQKKVIEKEYFKSGSIHVTKNIVRTDQFKIKHRFKQDLNIPYTHTTLLFVGRMIKEKGIYEVFKAFEKVAGDHENTTLIMVGWGPDQEALVNMAKSSEVANRVIFTGFIPEQEVVRYYANCDILVFPTYFPEGFPMALFNSVAAGMAIITTPTRAATDYLTEPDNCLWVKPQDHENVAAALSRLLNSKELCTAIKHKNLLKGNEFSKKQVSIELSQTLQAIT
ncbi:glycosyltransferase family 4 protein [Mucilaginibacter terrae]|uniref:Glycosyltransferase involved in cell wall biosynthesis n=1 Tax=Mucilaginibacter terrae TaxID=1955052 RepID=A0ABU3GQX6_9SPHI|nr:glycosyltransferase family 4 protein [Mucilaginibacter terrae]MDT3402180.1 glycosyltransferase involved in cell wall biosynthesis [Mucilaginibacter terrae]